MSDVSSHEISVTAKAEPAAPPAQPRIVAGEDPEKDTFLFDWSSVKGCGCCCCSFMLQLILTACLGSFLFGFNLGLLNTAISYISWEYQWCDWIEHPITDCTTNTLYQAFISTSIFIGAAIGSMTGGGFMSYGRRGMMLISCYVFIFGIISSCCANSFPAMLWARLVCGYSVGLISVCCPTYMSEVTPAAVRGKYGVLHQLFITVGIFVATLIGLPTALATPLPTGTILTSENPEDFIIPTFSRVWWRVMLGLGIIPVLVMMYLLMKVYKFETPHFYMEKNANLDAEELLKRLLAKSDVSQEYASINEEIMAGRRAKEAGMTLGAAWGVPEYRKVIFFGCVLSAFQQLGGINIFVASSTALFSQAGLEGNMAVVMTVVMTVINCLMTFPAVPLIEKLGRRTLMVIGTIWMTLVVLPAAICYWALPADSKITMWLAIVGCICYIIGFATTYGPVLWVYLFEIYPMEIKGAAAGLATAFNWIAGILMVFIQNFVENKILYLIFVIMCAISALIVFFFMLETKGRALGDSPYIKRK